MRVRIIEPAKMLEQKRRRFCAYAWVSSGRSEGESNCQWLEPDRK